MVPTVSKLWISILLLSLAKAFHQGWSSNVFTLASDIFPKNVVGRVISLAGFSAALTGALTATLTGIILQLTNSFTILFVIAGSMYILSWLILNWLIPVIEPITQIS